ncbi:DUF202 domain-containing protein [Actinomadura viridis]|uniref:DUF202 domain-containing protein n=1 Tax=Actinomadura viridis TaxID=58110 RepID=UPI00369C96C8
MRPPEDLEDLDPGLARARTELAWTRTAIGFAALGAAALKIAPAAGVPVLAMSALIYALGRWTRPAGRTGGHARPRHLLVVTVAVTLVSLAALAIAIFGPATYIRIR